MQNNEEITLLKVYLGLVSTGKIIGVTEQYA